ncbi:hypothetical protein NQ318_003669 [Aromia moschata]|uniref:Uncharacterized protein n=1 Tax=Aromia moschata TaxID=1265417 RepID=A0AAV8X2E8_9CUCU|nr:hypothetical protein NQ318_003669 [Aromia moschata]
MMQFSVKKYLRPGEDDDKLLHLLEVDSDIEGYDLEEDELDDGVFQEQDTARGDIVEMAIEEENVLEENDEDNDQIEGLDDEIVEISTSNEQVQQDEYDSEDNVPLSVLQKTLKAENNGHRLKMRNKKKKTFHGKNLKSFTE